MEDMALLKKISFFEGLTRTELLELNKLIHRAVFKAGQVIVEEGSACDAFFVIKRGTVRITSNCIELAELGAGEPLGEVSFIDKGPRSATVTATTDVELIMLPSDRFKELLETDLELGCRIYRAIAFTLCHRLRETQMAMQLVSC